MTGDRLSGDLGLISLFDVAQLLIVNRASGVLTIRNGEVTRYLYFAEGEIVNAVDENRREGDEGAFNVLATEHGAFAFDPAKLSPMKLVTLPAGALLMEAARRMDEQSAAAGGSGAGTDHRSHLESLEVLGRAFREISAARGRGSDELGPIVLEHPDDVAVIRSGMPVRVRSQGVWREVGDAADGVDLVGVRQRLLDGATALPPGPGGGSRWRIHRPDLRATVESFGAGAEEWLVLRPHGLEPPAVTQLRGSTGRLSDLVRRPQVLVLVGGPTASLVNRMLHSIVRMSTETLNGTCVVIEQEAIYGHAEAGGAVLHAHPQDGERVIRATQPDLVAIEAGGANAAAPSLFAALGCAPRLLVGVVSAESRPLVSLWLSSIEPAMAHQLEARLVAIPFGWVFAAREQDGVLTFDAGLLERKDVAAGTPRARAA